MARNDFRRAAERAEAAAYSADGWLAMGQRGRAAAIYYELRQIDAHTVKQLALLWQNMADGIAFGIPESANR